MFGGYVDLYAYGIDSSRKNTSDETLSKRNSSAESESDCCITSVFGGFRNWPIDRDDFILIGECEEIQGPSTLMIIPESAADNVDTNGLMLQLLSADYQGIGESNIVPYEDTQSLLPDIQPDIHVLVNYFVLLDIQARGYVRPMCVAYITPDKFKLAKMFLQLRNALVQACIPLKYYNWKIFCEEVKPMIENLKYTKKVRESSPTTKSSVVDKMQDENLDEALQDLKSKLATMSSLVEHENEFLEEGLRELLRKVSLQSHCPSFAHIASLLKYFDQIKSTANEPKILKVPLRQNFGSLLRPALDLTRVGLIKTVYELNKALKYFGKHYDCIALSADNDQNVHGMCLRFGSCVKGVCICENLEAKSDKMPKRTICSVENAPVEQHDVSLCIDEDFLKLFQQITSRNEVIHHHFSQKDDLGPSVLSGHSSLLKSGKRHNLLINQMFAVVEEWQGMQTEEKALHVLQSVFHKEELLYSVLKGRPILILASAEQRHLVEAVISVLSVIVPTSSRHPKSSELWTTRDIKESDLPKLAIIGLQCSDEELSTKVPKSILQKFSIFNMKKKKLLFPHYKGELLVGIAKILKNLPPKGPVMSVLISFLSDLELQVQFFRLLIEARGEISALRYFLNKGYSDKDMDLLWRLSGLLE